MGFWFLVVIKDVFCYFLEIGLDRFLRKKREDCLIEDGLIYFKKIGFGRC